MAFPEYKQMYFFINFGTVGLRLLHVKSDTIPGTDDQGGRSLVHGWRQGWCC